MLDAEREQKLKELIDATLDSLSRVRDVREQGAPGENPEIRWTMAQLERMEAELDRIDAGISVRVEFTG